MSEQPPSYQPAPGEGYAQSYAAERKPSTALIAIGWVFAGLAILVPFLGIVGLVMGIILAAQGWPRHGVPIIAASVLIMVLAGVLWYFYYYS